MRPGRRLPARRLAALLLSGLLSIVTTSGSASAQAVPSASADQASPFALHIDVASRRFRVPASWIRAVMRAESAHNVRAVSSAGAIGLMQVMPETWLELRARHGLGSDPFDPRDNILAGAAYLREMYDRYGNVSAMLAAYNAGPRRYDEYLAGTRNLPAETRAYVATIAPLLGAEPLPYAMSSAPGDPLAWMSAPLFARSDDGRQAAAMHPERQRESMPNAPRMQDASALSARSRALFVARGGSERPQ
nr:lytic transglycosylase domain-containing protein [Propylenella binzhouense]